MCELGGFLSFLKNDLLKVDKIVGLTRKTLKDSKRRLSSYCS